MTHYRKAGNVTHCGAEILPNGKDIPYIVIERIEFKEKVNIGGRDEVNQFIAHFAPNPYTKLPMVLNRTNQGRLMKLFPQCGTDIDTLKNVAVRLTSEKARNIAMDMYLPALRISKIPAKKPEAEKPQKVTLTKDSENFEKVKKYIREGGKIEDLSVKYIIPEDVVAELKVIAEAVK